MLVGTKKSISLLTLIERAYGIGYQFYEKIKNVASEIYRAEFHEITPSGIENGLKNAVLFSRSNTNLYQSFLGRIASDQVVGFALTSYLRNSLNLSELSAGRVQTPALALICQRDQEIRILISWMVKKK
ncbi:hypothetical protein JP0120_08370 [Helicobacter pylori]|nr:hypothetical protein JP0120_08370 [Helicobacter pylori]